ncbi:uncharacterized protein LOC141642273 [Silene latifolia]|uniref:uncharacterized protein LOC141642273 n=1 Tax=Silene latifolia TaxID=37657 RepID=UPI003D78A65F
MASFHFPQFEHEPFYCYFDRLGEYVGQFDNCFETWELCLVVYYGMNQETWTIVNYMCGGQFIDTNYLENWELFRRLANDTYQWDLNTPLPKSNLEIMMEQFIETTNQYIDTLAHSSSDLENVENFKSDVLSDNDNGFVESCEFVPNDNVIVSLDFPTFEHELNESSMSSLENDNMFNGNDFVESYVLYHVDNMSPLDDIIVLNESPSFVQDVVEQFGECELETMLFHDDYELGEPSDTLVIDELDQFGICEYESMSFEVDHEMEELSKECFEESGIFNESWKKESLNMFDDSLEVKWDDDVVDIDSFGEPTFARFFQEASMPISFIEDDSLISVDFLPLDLFTPSYEYMIEKDECDHPFKEVVLAPRLTFDDYLSDNFEDKRKEEVRGKKTSEVSNVVDWPLLVGFDHSPPMKEEILYKIEFENVEENDHNLDDYWRKLKDVSFIDLGKELSGLAHRLWDPG